MRRTSAYRAVVLGLLLSLLAAGGASAGQVTLEGDTWVYRGSAAREVFYVFASDQGADEYRFSQDIGSIGTIPNGCRREGWDDETTIRCPFRSGVRAEMGDGDDWAFVSDDLAPHLQVAVDGGPGNDRLSGPLRGVAVTFSGGDGSDELDGGELADVLDGGPGNDRIDGDGGNDVLRGGDGDDVLEGDGLTVGSDVIDGGAGYDKSESDWIQPGASAGLAISLDGVANDGHPGEGDNVIAMEEITLTQPVSFVGGADGVRVRIYNHASGSSTVHGSAGNDDLRTHDYVDTIDGKGGDDTIEGGYGDDTITGGPGRDTINAEAGTGSCNFLVCRAGVGNDTINVRDGEVDSVTCGVGTDTVVADAADTIAADCENVDRGAVVQPPERRAEQPRRRGAAKRCVVPRVKAGAKPAAAKRALAKRGCKAKTKKIRSGKIRSGRVVKLSHKAGKKLAHKKTITVYVSRGRR